MADAWRPMSSAPRDGTMIDVTIIHPDGHSVCVPACWMAPGGRGEIADWWSAGATTGSRSYEGLPHNFEPCAISPASWKPRQEPEPRAKALRRLAAMRLEA